MKNENTIDIIDLAAKEMIPSPDIPAKMGLSYEEEQMAYCRLAKGMAVAAITALGKGDAEKLKMAKDIFLTDFEETLKVAANERSQTE